MKRRRSGSILARDFVMPRSMRLYAGDITPALVMMLAGTPPDAVEAAIEAWMTGGLLEPPPVIGGFPRVASPVRTGALASATPRQRRTAYAELAHAIDDPDATEFQQLVIARAYREGGCHRLAIARYLGAAERFLERAERHAARDVFDEIVASMPAHEPELLAALDLAARSALTEGDFERADAFLERLRRLASVCGDRHATVRALVSSAECRIRTEAPDAAIAFATRAIDSCGPGSELAHERAAAALAIVEARCDRGRLTEARADFAGLATCADDREPARAARFALVAGKLRAAGDDPVAAVTAFRAAVAAADNALDTGLRVTAHRALADALLQCADLFGAASTLRSALAIATAAKLPAVAAALRVDLAELQFESGRFPEAVRAPVTDIAARDTPRLLRLALLIDDRAAIDEWTNFDALEDALATALPRRIASVVPAFAALERLRSDDLAAQALYRRAIDVLTAADSRGAVDFWCDAAQFGSAADCERVRAALVRARPHAAPLAALSIELGCLALDIRNAPGDENLTVRADTLARTFLAAGFKARARRTRSLIASDRPTGRGGHVIALIGAGLSNAEIATQLYVSKRTIEKTISDMLRARGLRSRWQLLESTPRSAKPPLTTG